MPSEGTDNIREEKILVEETIEKKKSKDKRTGAGEKGYKR